MTLYDCGCEEGQEVVIDMVKEKQRMWKVIEDGENEWRSIGEASVRRRSERKQTYYRGGPKK